MKADGCSRGSTEAVRQTPVIYVSVRQHDRLDILERPPDRPKAWDELAPVSRKPSIERTELPALLDEIPIHEPAAEPVDLRRNLDHIEPPENNRDLPRMLRARAFTTVKGLGERKGVATIQSVPKMDRSPRALRRAMVQLTVEVALASLVAAIPTAPSASSQPNITQGFLLQGTETGLASFDLTNFAFLPGGDMLVIAKSGALRLVTQTGVSSSIATNPSISVNSCGDRGLLGIALANNYATSGTLYLLYDTPAMSRCPSTYPLDQSDMIWGRLSQWTADNPSAPSVLTGENVLADDILSDGGPSHSIGTVLVAPDDTLFFGAGDGAAFSGVDPAHALRAQMTDSPNGKILHINPDGSGVTTNPFYDPTAPNSWHSKVYAMGLRNPFRFDLRPGTSTLYVGDVGWSAWEELDVGRPGANYGWPCWEGPAHTFGYQDLSYCQTFYSAVTPNAPLWSYSHIWAPGAAVIGGTFYTGTSYPPPYQGAYFFGDYVTGTIWTLTTDAEDNLTRPPELGTTPSDGFATGIGSPVAFHTGPSGDIYIADIASSTIERLRYFPSNTPPVPVASSDATNGSSSLKVSFTGSGSYDPDGDQLTYSWDFGDGSAPAPVSDTVHTYPASGDYTATLTVTDSLGASSSASITVKPSDPPPTLSLATPPQGTLLSVGELFSLTATATSSQGDAIPSSSISWRADIHHCPIVGSCHIHPGSTVTGTVLAMTFPDHGDASHLEITATATDSFGVSTSATYIASPEVHTLSISSSPQGVPLEIDTTTSIAHPLIALTAGSTNFVVAPGASGALQFKNWSDGGAIAHSFTMPHQDLAMTAFYQSSAPPPSPINPPPGSSTPGPPATSLTSLRHQYFGEGSTLDGFREYLLLSNPGASASTASIRYSFDDGTPDTTSALTVPPGTRQTIDVATVVGTGHQGVAVDVTSDSSVVAERSVYFDRTLPIGEVNGVHSAIGGLSARTAWSFAEGSTLAGFQEYLTLMNPGDEAAQASITFGLEGGGSRIVSPVVVQAHGRATIDVDALIGPVSGHATTISSSAPIVAERPMYFNRPVGDDPTVINGGHVAFGSIPKQSWYFAEGTVLPDFSMFVTLGNPDPSAAANVTLHYFLTDGSLLTRSATVASGSRRTVAVFDPTDPAGIGRAVSDPIGRGVALWVTTPAQTGVVAERSEYFHHTFGDAMVNDGHSTPGAAAPANEWTFAEGSTLPGFFPYLTVLNPGGSSAELTITYTPDTGPQIVRSISAPGSSRLTIPVFGPPELAGVGSPITGFGISVRSTAPVVVERPLYVNRVIPGLPIVNGGSDVVGRPG
jgi:glucose/arabinose dehydrogenase